MQYPLLTGGAGTYCTHQHSISTSDRQAELNCLLLLLLRHARPRRSPPSALRPDRSSAIVRALLQDIATATYLPTDLSTDLPTYPFQPSKFLCRRGGKVKGREKVEYAQASNSTGGVFFCSRNVSLCLPACLSAAGRRSNGYVCNRISDQHGNMSSFQMYIPYTTSSPSKYYSHASEREGGGGGFFFPDRLLSFFHQARCT